MELGEGDDSPTQGGDKQAAGRQKKKSTPEKRNELLTFEIFERLFHGHKALRSLSVSTLYREATRYIRTRRPRPVLDPSQSLPRRPSPTSRAAARR